MQPLFDDQSREIRPAYVHSSTPTADRKRCATFQGVSRGPMRLSSLRFLLTIRPWMRLLTTGQIASLSGRVTHRTFDHLLLRDPVEVARRSQWLIDAIFSGKGGAAK